jgi:hypothetical protein
MLLKDALVKNNNQTHECNITKDQFLHVPTGMKIRLRTVAVRERFTSGRAFYWWGCSNTVYATG